MQIKLKRIPRVRRTTENQNNIQGKCETQVKDICKYVHRKTAVQQQLTQQYPQIVQLQKPTSEETARIT